MLARRLLVLVAVLTGLTLVAAILAPPPPAPEVRTRPPAGATGTGAGAEVERTVSTSAGGDQAVAVEEGDLVRLTVEGREPQTVEIRGMARVGTLDALTPAVFSILADEPGEYPIVVLDTEETVGTLHVVSARER